MSDPLADQFFKARARLSRLLGRSFPDASAEEVEDALSDALVVMVGRAAPVVGSVPGLLYTIAWRRLRGEFRRHARRLNQSIPCFDHPGLSQDAGQDVVVSAARWLRHFEATIAEHGKTQSEALRRALLDKMETGDPDGVVAERHDITRARLNRAWNMLLDSMLEG
ncbi:hypothetical protein L6R49_05180 [Myxococcota bacterium]|nr:hypothetical protein [Myxococcota bacterium]